MISILGLALLPLLGQPLPPWPRTEPVRELLPLLVVTFVTTLLYGGPLGEETGWRGFALPRLQARHSPLVASLLLSVVWGLWHVPLHLQGVYQGIFPDGLPGILLRIVITIPTTVLFTWFFNRTRGNLWLVVLLHTAVNNTAGFWLPVTAGVYAAMAIMMVTLIITDRMWRLRPPEGTTAPASGQVEALTKEPRGNRMSQDNDHSGAADAGDSAAAHARTTSVGVGIGLGAGLGLVAGLLLGDMLLGMLSGAGLGTVVVALYELWRRPAAREHGKHDG